MPIHPGVCFTIYDKTTADLPGVFVVRPFVWHNPDARLREPVPFRFACVVRDDELDAQRDLLLWRGLFCMPRQPGDDPVILETWL